MNITNINTAINDNKINSTNLANEKEQVSFGMSLTPQMDHLGHMLKAKGVKYLDKANLEILVPRAFEKLDEDNVVNEAFKKAMEEAELVKKTSLAEVIPDFAHARVPVLLLNTPDGLEAKVCDANRGIVRHLVVEGNDWHVKVANGHKSLEEGLRALAHKFAINSIATSTAHYN